MKEHAVEPYALKSVDDAIEDQNLRERDYQNLLYSAANLNRPVAKCNVCKLDHDPVLPDVLKIKMQRREDKREGKKDQIKQTMLKGIEHQKKRQGQLKLAEQYSNAE